MRYRALFLDFYGTLVAEDDQVISSICSRASASIKDAQKTKEFGRRWSELFAGMCSEACDEAFKTQQEIELASLSAAMAEFSVVDDAREASKELYHYWRQPAAFPESHEFLKICPVPICIVSNIDTSDLLSAANSHGWSFQHVVTSEMARSYKPRSEIFKMALSRMGVSASEVLHVGDSLSSDIRGAAGIGIATAWINRAGRKLPDNQVVPTYMTPSLSALLEKLLARPPV